MPIEIVLIAVEDKAVLWDRMQAYMAELMPFGNFAPVNGVFQYPRFELYWSKEGRYPYWCVADGQRAAFALVHRHAGTEMAEFYSFPEFRRKGTALEFARRIIRRFPGAWTISQYRAHVAAVTFWHRVIAEWSFNERVYVGGEGKERLEQTFVVASGVSV